MKVDVTECIIELLHSNKTVGLPGIGSFFVQNINSKLDAGKIYPPYKSVQFNKEDVDSTALIDFIRNKYKINKSTSASVVKKFTQLLLNKMVNFKQVRLPNLGSFTSSPSGVSFVEERNLINAAKGLLPVFEVPKISIREVKSDTPAVAAVSSAGSSIAPPSSEKKVTSSSSIVSSTKSVETKPIYTSPPPKQTGCFNYFWPLLFLLLVGALLIFGLRKCTDYVNNNGVTGDRTESNLSKDSSETNDSDAGLAYDPNQEYSLEEAQQFSDAVFKDGCIVIVGSFRKNRNALRMVDKVESFGYDSHKSLTDKGLTRVGIKLKCDAEVLESLIQKIRKEIEPTSWYLIPNVKVEY